MCSILKIVRTILGACGGEASLQLGRDGIPTLTAPSARQASGNFKLFY